MTIIISVLIGGVIGYFITNKLLNRRAPVGLHQILSSFPAIINGHDSVCIKGTQEHNQTKEYADCHRKPYYKRGKYKSQKYTANVSHKNPCPGEIER